MLIENLIVIEGLVGSVVHIADKEYVSRVIGAVIISQVNITKSAHTIGDLVKLEPTDEPFFRIELQYSGSLKSTRPPTSMFKCINETVPIPPNTTGLLCFFRYGCHENDTVRLMNILGNDVLQGQTPVNTELIYRIVNYRGFSPLSDKSKVTTGLDTSFYLNLKQCANIVESKHLSDTQWIEASTQVLERLTLSPCVISDFLSLDKIINTTQRKRMRDVDELHTLTTVRRVAKEQESLSSGKKRKRRREEKTMYMHLMDVRAYIRDELRLKHTGAEYVAWPPDQYRYPLTTMPVCDSQVAYSVAESWHYRLGMDEDVFNFKEMSRDDLVLNGCISLQDILGDVATAIVLSEWVFYIRESIYPAIFDSDATLKEVLVSAMNDGKLDKQGSGSIANLCFLPAKMLVDGSPVLKHLYEDFVYRSPFLIHEPSNFFVDLPFVRKQRRTLLYDNLFEQALDTRDRYSGLLVLSCEPEAHVIECLVNAHKVRYLMREFYHPKTGYEAYRLKDFGNTKPQQLSSAHFDIDEFNNFACVCGRMLGFSIESADVLEKNVVKYQDFCCGLIHRYGVEYLKSIWPPGPISTWLPEWTSFRLKPRSIFLWNNKCPIRFVYKPNDPDKPLICLELDYQPIDPSAHGSLKQEWYVQRMKRLMSYKVRSDRSTKIQNRWEWPMVSTLKKRKDELNQCCRLAHGPYTLYLFDKHPQYYQTLPNRNIDVLRGFSCHKEDSTLFFHKDYYESLNEEMI